MLPVETGQLRAIILDVDGTLYPQRPLRRVMLWRLLRAYVGRPLQGLLALRVLHAYRRAQENLRTGSFQGSDLAQRQRQLASEWTGVPSEVVGSHVRRWMEREPLAVLAPRSLCHGAMDFLSAAQARGLQLGVFSDYPATAKLTAMGVADLFDAVVSAHDPEVQRFKPSPRGLDTVLRRLGVETHQALYVGDRPEIDAAAARNAGMACVIIGGRRMADRRGCIAMRDYRELTDAISSG